MHAKSSVALDGNFISLRHNSFANFCVNDFYIGIRPFYLHLMRLKRNRMVVFKLNNNNSRCRIWRRACFGFFGTFPATQSLLSLWLVMTASFTYCLRLSAERDFCISYFCQNHFGSLLEKDHAVRIASLLRGLARLSQLLRVQS